MMSSSSDRGAGRRWPRRIARVAAAAALAPFALWAALELVARFGSYPVGDLARDRGSTRMFDARGRLLREAVGGGGVRSEWTPLDHISPLVVQATLAAEDARFHDHAGVDWRSAVRAGGQAVRHLGIVSGASTLTMQVVRLIHLRTEHLGPDELLVGAKVELDGHLTVAQLAVAIDDLEARVRAVVPAARVMYVEPDIARPAQPDLTGSG